MEYYLGQMVFLSIATPVGVIHLVDQEWEAELLIITVDPPQNSQGLGNIPKAPKVRSFTEVDTGLNARRGNRGDQCPVPEFDMKKQYENFMQEMSEKGYELECN